MEETSAPKVTVEGKQVLALHSSLDLLERQLEIARRYLDEGATVSEKGTEFQSQLRDVASSEMWAMLCW